MGFNFGSRFRAIVLWEAPAQKGEKLLSARWLIEEEEEEEDSTHNKRQSQNAQRD